MKFLKSIIKNVRLLRGNRRSRALNELRAELEKLISGGTLPNSYLCGSDSSTRHYLIGAEITISFDDEVPLEKVRDVIPEIKHLNEHIAKKYDLVAVGVGPIIGEMAITMICCGFWHEE